jgi:6-pyruvoyltetrahydropterin/6-carboxytetrahydropterin synthase
MGCRYTISTEITFSSSHALRGYNGDCARVHGHNWVVRVYYDFEILDANGFAIDYGELKSRLEKVILPRFDHLHLNDSAPFYKVNPTSENVAAEIFRLCREKVRIENGTLAEVEVWETPTDMVRYRDDTL